jgi:hypothetical protein
MVETRGSAENLAIVFAGGTPEPFIFERGQFHMAKNSGNSTLQLKSVRMRLADTALNISGVLHDPFKDLRKAEIDLDGDMRAHAIKWLFELIDPPQVLALNTPLSVSASRLTWIRDDRTTFKGAFSTQNGPHVAIDLHHTPSSFKINELKIRDEESRALIRLDRKANTYHAALSGILSCDTLGRLFKGFPAGNGSIQGDMRADITTGKRLKISAEGFLSAHNLDLSHCFPLPLRIEELSLDAQDNHFSLDNTVINWEDQRVSLKGDVEVAMPAWRLDLSASIDDLNWDRIKQLTSPGEGRKRSFLSGLPAEMPVRGNISISAENFTLGKFTWAPLTADVIFQKSGMDIAVAEARICGIDTPGVVNVTPSEIRLEFKPSSRNQDVASTVACLREGEVLSSGKFDLSGRVSAQAATDRLMEAATGSLTYQAKEGRIYRNIPLARLFAYLDLIGIFDQIIPRVREEGFPYRSILVNGEIEKNKLVITEGIIDSPIMEIVLQGDIDLMEERLDLDVLAAPMQSVNYVIKRVPLVNQIMGGTLISIPIKIEGQWADPRVTPLQLSMVRSSLVGIMKRTLQLPIKLIEPIMPQKEPVSPSE